MKPPGIPASATIWAEVVDGLGRKVGAWFDGGDVPLVEMWDPDSGHPWSWAPDCESQWMGDFDERMTPSAAAQCRQLYERGMKEQAEIKAWAENMAGFVCDESIDTGAKVAAVLAAEATHQALAEDLEDYRPSAEELAAAADARGEEAPAPVVQQSSDVRTRPLPSGEQLRKAFADAANRCSAENGSDTPDHVLGDFLTDCLMALDSAINKRDLLCAPAPVDLTELREAWKAVPDFQPHPITKPVRALFDAVEKLLSSGGAL